MGTAVYQVGRASFIQPKNFSASNPGAHQTDAPEASEAVTAAKSGTTPITLIIRNGDRFRTVSFDYRGGLRYPRLERIEGTPDRLGDILTARRR